MDTEARAKGARPGAEGVSREGVTGKGHGGCDLKAGWSSQGDGWDNGGENSTCRGPEVQCKHGFT